MVRRIVLAVALAVALALASMTAAWAPKRYVAPSNGQPAQVSLPHQPPIRGGG